MKHKQVLEKITQEYYADPEVKALYLYGSVARNEETENSDIDLWVIKETDTLIRQHKIYDGIVVETWEISNSFLERLLEAKDDPVISSFIEGKIIFDKGIGVHKYIERARELYDEGPSYGSPDEFRQLMKRCELTDMLNDIADVMDDEGTFNLIASELVSNVYNMIYENQNIWRVSRKKVIETLEKKVPEAGEQLRNALNCKKSKEERFVSLEWLVNYVLNPYGGIIQGDCVIVNRRIE